MQTTQTKQLNSKKKKKEQRRLKKDELQNNIRDRTVYKYKSTGCLKRLTQQVL